jgi:hypothetical protein
MTEYVDEVFALIQTAYAPIGGNIKFRKPADLFDSDYWKLIRRNGRIIAACIYKLNNGRKQVAMGHTGTKNSKLELMKLLREDAKFKRIWAEVSGAAAKFIISIGFEPIPNEYAADILQKEILALKGRFKYDRLIAGHIHTKVIVGFPGDTQPTSKFDMEEVLF